MNKWDWNEPITWKQSIIFGAIGGFISIVSTIVCLYGEEIGEKINNAWKRVRKYKREE